MEENQQYGSINSAQAVSETPHPRHGVRMIFITFIVLAMALGGYVILSNSELKGRMQEALNLKMIIPEKNITQKNDIQIFSSQIQDRLIPWVEVKGSDQPVGLGEEFKVSVTAFSGGRDINGYDILLGVDPEQFEVVSVQPATTDFQIQSFDRGMYHAITGYKNLQVKTPTVLEDTAVLLITLKPKVKGQLLVTVLAKKDQEKTQFIDKDVNVIEPQVGSMFITVH